MYRTPILRARCVFSGARLTFGFVGALWVVAATQHVVLPQVGVGSWWVISTFGATPLAPFNVGRWVASLFIHTSFVHLLKNTIPLLVLGVYYETTYGRRTLVVLSASIGLGTYAVYIALSSVAYAGLLYYAVGASAIWYGLLAYGALSRDALVLPRPGHPQLGVPVTVRVPFSMLLVACLGYVVGALTAEGFWTVGTAHEAHLISAMFGVVCWGVAYWKWPRARQSRSPLVRRISRISALW